MIVKVFDHIYISNVYNANDIYHLINLNIGGVLTCFRCMSIEWCHHDPKENRKIFYKDKFLKCKGELLRDPGGRDFPLPLCQSIAGGRKNGHQLGASLTPCSSNVGEEPTEGGDTSTQGATEHSEEDLFAKPYAHYDYIIYPLEIVKKKIVKETIDDYVKAMHVEKAHAFIDEVIRSEKNVLVHCMAGISRCSSIILSYISKKNGKSIAENFATLKDRYPFAHPNESFYRQLLLYERMNYTLDGRSEYHLVYEEMKRDRGALERLKCLNLKNEPDATYKFRCKLCRFTLFNDNDIIQHQLDKYKIKKKYGHSCTSIFIEKKEWLLTNHNMKGVLICPNKNVINSWGCFSALWCSAKLGKWSWTGICCSCGYLQIPAFMINTSNVDRMKINPS
ncbi:dual-specificity protein phosphatase [Plasmodium cynomolgi strain B]|uniref:protein-tyrosine-phosphatase n=1 Tax=Plasmodium cynomolgi (strain B) TaxID=1120755 RepID=K6UJU3_PLACD|nr:dual-specificity protein phosphatase [Plasmodium cynomolgi strain B]GAB66243.1 dual-specificity protein phosphatase [Plasmodium cynomolgi strain B]